MIKAIPFETVFRAGFYYMCNLRLLSFLGKKTKEQPSQENVQANDSNELDICSGMRVEVTAFDGRLLFVAKLMGPNDKKAELHQYSEAGFPQTEEPLHVRIRGYNDHLQRAVYMEGIITPMPKHIWNVEELTVVRTGNERAFFRLDTNLDASVTMFSGLAMGERPCKMLNISVGGACISSEHKYYTGDKFLLKVKLMDDRPESAMFCQVLRVTERDNGRFEYGCRFLELTDANQEQITQNIYAVQRQKRGRA